MKLEILFLAMFLGVSLCTETCTQSSDCYHHCGRQTFSVCMDGICVCPPGKREVFLCKNTGDCQGYPCYHAHLSAYCHFHSPHHGDGVCDCH